MLPSSTVLPPKSSSLSSSHQTTQASNTSDISKVENQSSPPDLPFLVTHWLANFEAGNIDGSSNDEHRRAVERIRNATSEIASAFASLGAFGTSIRPSLGASFLQQSRRENSTYSDVRRRWNGISPSHLENLAEAVASTNSVADHSATNSLHSNLLAAASEKREIGLSDQSSSGNTGHSLSDAIDVDSINSTAVTIHPGTFGNSASILHSPVLLESDPCSTATGKNELSPTIEGGSSIKPLPMIQADSSYAKVGQQTAETMRKLFETRDKVQEIRLEMRGLNASLKLQAAILESLNQKYRTLSTEGDMKKLIEVGQEVRAGKSDCERVTAQLKRKLSDLSTTLSAHETELSRLESASKNWERRRRQILQGFRDPFAPWKGKLAPGHRVGANPILKTLLGRQHGLRGTHHPTLPRQDNLGKGMNKMNFVATRRALLSTRLSHAATINSHLNYPVYCLRFDRTGRYFFTGADDYLVKVFSLGAGQSCRKKNDANGSRQLRCNYGANLRGAVLVCSLRGHAGVVNDIDVSSDNAFLATASVDGDVRVWGLRDGSPVAILRGHKGGANMVSWSKTTPYRLVSTGSDGFARLWDIREACLKRYGTYIGKRPEYRLKLTASEKKVGDNRSGGNRSNQSLNGGNEAFLPPLPVRQNLSDRLAATGGDSASTAQPFSASSSSGDQSNISLVVPPLPPAVPPLPIDEGAREDNAGSQQNGDQREIAPPGQFVANDEIDEGVKLLMKYKHGSSGPEVAGPGTRSRRSAVNVICVARCPLGGHFSTGSDDGVCRVFADREEPGVAVVDKRANENFFKSNEDNGILIRKQRDQSSDEPILKLLGHVSAITDLSYSHSGDRILSASQKDGVVRLWSIGTRVMERSSVDDGSVPQIVIKLTDPSSVSSRRHTHLSRRVPGNGSTSRSDVSKVSCDVAVWTHDDSKVVTSQCILVKQNGSEIQPGSQYLFLWDSMTGQCILGIAGAHTMQCPVVIPHPTDSSLLCTAAADGFAKVWDWESGNCLFKHRNQVDFGFVESGERNKLAGYLDGSFSPDGTKIVLTDDSGRVTILDSASPKGETQETESFAWMKEQYFANDYYELFYDRSGYCIERGSERPPHLAPRSVRCNHTGTPWSDDITETYLKLVGPMPLPEHVCRWHRQDIHARAIRASNDRSSLFEASVTKARRGVREFDPATTILVRASGIITEKQTQAKSSTTSNHGGQSGRRSSSGGASAVNSSRTLSANYRYLDYDDMIREQGNQDEAELDTDDEEFNPTARSRDVVQNSDESDDELDVELEADSPFRVSNSRRRGGVQSGERRARSQRRAQRRDAQFTEIDSDDEMVTQFVQREWLKRSESDTSYEGRKIYTPQLGDSVVYIPRAHFETLSDLPSLYLPWQRWPQGTAWPVVRCCVRGIRFRFPYEDYYRVRQAMCDSIVAVLTLEVTGIPELSEDRQFPWPKPSFIDSTRAFVFEVSVFANDKCEYIYPEGLYTGRLRALERSILDRGGHSALPVSVYFNAADAVEDSPMEASQGIISALNTEDSRASPHLTGSGFGVIRFEMPDYADDFSPWDIAMSDLSISRPYICEDDKKIILENLNVQLRKESVAEHLSMPVNTNRYSDYYLMVEVEMNLMAVKGRLAADYYASKVSVVGDLRLIRDNCMKYNGIDNDLVRIATVMCEDFEAKVLSEEERVFLISEDEFNKMSRPSQSLETSQAPTARLSLPQRTNHVTVESHSASDLSSGSNRGGLRRQTSLESLPAPASERRRELRRNAQPQNLRLRSSSIDTNSSEALGHRRSLRSRGQRSNLESLTRVGEHEAGSPRTRRTRHGSNSRGEIETRVTRESNPRDDRALRRSGRQPRRLYMEEDSELEQEIEEEESPRTRRSAQRLQRASSRSSVEQRELDTERVVAARARRPQRARRSTTSQQASNSIASAESESEAAESESEAAVDDSESESAISDNEDEYESDRKRPRRSTALRSSPRTKRTSNSSNVESPTRRSSRARAKNHAAYEEANSSDFDELEEEESEESEAEEIKNSRSRSRQVKSYAEVPSDFDEDSSDDESTARKQKAKPARKKRQASGSISPTAKRMKTTIIEEIQLNDWPEVDLREISLICEGVLARVREEDVDGIFLEPVLEQHPEIKDSYLQAVDTPMDLRTIEEDRLPQYQQIVSLQEDLVLTFRNCCLFNGANSSLGEYARNIWMQLNIIFENVCKENEIMLPRRWKP